MRRRVARLAVKRAIDVAVAAVGLVLSSPLLALIAVGVRLRLGRPLLYRQVRPGRDEQLFTIVKFRSMTDAVDDTGALLPDAQRLTRFGNFLRNSSLDELPQLVNVLRGDMSLVGPRPLLVEYLPLYSPEQRRRHAMRPGMTGWSQVTGRAQITWADHLAADAWYVENWSLRLDFRILARTVRAVIRREGVSVPGTRGKFAGTGTG